MKKNENPRLRYALSRIKHMIIPPISLKDTPDEMVIRQDIDIPMRDGIILKANIFLPKKTAYYPTIASLHFYGKDNFSLQKKRIGKKIAFQFRVSRQVMPFSISEWTTWEAPDPVYWTNKGYAVVNIDSRGFNKSEGIGSIFSDQEAEDYYDAIQWIAEQEWSNGNVGLLGVSYLAISQWKVAALNPPSLKAICPWEGLTDPYEDFFYPGGVKETGFSQIWLSGLKKLGRVDIDYKEKINRTTRKDEFYEAMVPDLEKISIPSLICCSFSDHMLHTRGSFRGFTNINSKQKWAYTHRGPKWATFYSDEALETQLRFFDHFLKGEDNDWDKTPPVRLEVRDTNDKIYETIWIDSWPPENIEWREFYLNSQDNSLGKKAGDHFITLSLPKDRIDFYYTFNENAKICGPMSLQFPVQCDDLPSNSDVHLFATIFKYRKMKNVPFEGTMGFGYDSVTQGRIKVENNGIIMIYLMESATYFAKGDTLKLSISGHKLYRTNPLFGLFPFNLKPSDKRNVRIECSEKAFLKIPYSKIIREH